MRNLIVLSLFISLLIIALRQPANTNNVQSVPRRTGAPGDAISACSASPGCHNGPVQSVDESVIALKSLGINDISNGYIPMSAYDLDITIKDTGMSVFGFQLLAIDTNGNQAGNFMVTNSQRTTLVNDNSKEYIMHKDANSNASWSFKWNSPSTYIGPIYFFIGAIAGNGDLTNLNDNSYKSVYTATSSVFENKSNVLLTRDLIVFDLCQGDTGALYIDVSGGLAPYSYSWTPTTNLSNPNAAFTYAYPSMATTYSVEVTDFAGNSGTSTRTIGVALDTFLQGLLVDTLGNRYKSIQSFLIEYNDQDSSITSVDSAFSNSVGRYTLDAETGVKYFVKAVPDSQTYPFLLPTYLGGVLTVQEATPYSLNTCSEFNTHTMIRGNNPGGPGFIGGLISQGAGKQSQGPAVGVNLVLVNNNNEPVTYTTTDQNGNFSFANLALGTYKLWVDQLRINNSLAPQVTLSAGNQQLTNLPYTLEDTVLLEGITNISQIDKSNPIVAYPNPANTYIYVNGVQNKQVVKVYSLQGRLMLSQSVGQQNNRMDVSALPAGLYFLHIEGEQGNWVQKVIIQ